MNLHGEVKDCFFYSIANSISGLGRNIPLLLK